LSKIVSKFDPALVDGFEFIKAERLDESKNA